jgi:hypothetical protein
LCALLLLPCLFCFPCCFLLLLCCFATGSVCWKL